MSNQHKLFELVLCERFNGEKTGKKISIEADTGFELYDFQLKNKCNGSENYQAQMQLAFEQAKKKAKRIKNKIKKKKLGKGRQEILEYQTQGVH